MASTRRPSPSGSRGSQFLWIFGPDPRSPDRLVPSQSRKRPPLSPSEGILCCRSTNSLYALQPTVPHLTRSSLHTQCLQRHGISLGCRRSKAKPRPSANPSAHPIGYFYIDIAEVRTAQGKLFASPPSSTERRSSPARRDAREGGASHRGGLPAPPGSPPSLTRSIPSSPTTEPISLPPGKYELGGPGHQGRPGGQVARRAHAFEYACAQNNIDHH